MDDHLAAFEAFRRSAFHVLTKPYRTGSLGVRFDAFAGAYDEARSVSPANRSAAKDFFERHFVPAKVQADNAGLVTGFYEPEVEASPVRTDQFTVPLLARPGDLIDIDGANRPEGMDEYLAFARDTPQGPVEYFDRGQIERGALAGKGLEPDAERTGAIRLGQDMKGRTAEGFIRREVIVHFPAGKIGEGFFEEKGR